ncbi:NADPH dehydrogenase 1 [Mycena venus]|uniref:NADPH dehydrogenase 1 n=1 Tax=Mycena venus TaxID=2733690 RepID=A0A8H6Y4Q1_9AGAR|nr:NADPH dehydrogenase 1 [Mycena venus]
MSSNPSQHWRAPAPRLPRPAYAVQGRRGPRSLSPLRHRSNQRARKPGTLLITEATFITARAGRCADIPDIWNPEQIKAVGVALGAPAHGEPRVITSRGPLAALRLSLPYVPVSDIPLAGHSGEECHRGGVRGSQDPWRERLPHRPVPARRLKQAHDDYSGIIENHTRFALEVVDAVVCCCRGRAHCYSIQLVESFQEEWVCPTPFPPSPTLYRNSRCAPRTSHTCTSSSRASAGIPTADDAIGKHESNKALRAPPPPVYAGGFTRAGAIEAAESGGAELVAFERLYISNVRDSFRPDLPMGLEQDVLFTPFDRGTFYDVDEDSLRGELRHLLSNHFSPFLLSLQSAALPHPTNDNRNLHAPQRRHLPHRLRQHRVQLPQDPDPRPTEGALGGRAHAAEGDMPEGGKGAEVERCDAAARRVEQAHDEYGGSIENHTYFVLEVFDAVVAAVSAEHTAIRFSRWSPFLGASLVSFLHFVAGMLISIVYFPKERNGHARPPLHLLINYFGTRGTIPAPRHESNEALLAPRPLACAGVFTQAGLIEAAKGPDELVAFKRLYISNPDLPTSLEQGVPLDRGTFYIVDEDGQRGYTGHAFAT